MLAVLQRLEQGVRFFTADGEFISYVGGAGQGPGEFDNAIRLGRIADTLWVIDGDLERVTLLQIDGTVLRTSEVGGLAHFPSGDMEGARYRFRAQALLPDGSLLASVSGMPEDGGTGTGPSVLGRVTQDRDSGRWTIN